MQFVLPAPKNPFETRKLLQQLQQYPVYGLLLLPDPNHSFAKMIKERWDELHHMTGSKFLLFAFQPPDTFSGEFESSWRQQLGEKNFEAFWTKWQQDKTSRYGAYDFEGMFADRKVRRTEMPCLALFTSAEAKRAAIVRIPDWNEQDLWNFLRAVCDIIDECAIEPKPEARLTLIKGSLTSFPARAKQNFAHLAGKAEAYFRAHPVKVAITTVSILISLSTANVLPIGAAGISIMKDAVDILKSV